jgi:hypothetical protein
MKFIDKFKKTTQGFSILFHPSQYLPKLDKVRANLEMLDEFTPTLNMLDKQIETLNIFYKLTAKMLDKVIVNLNRFDKGIETLAMFDKTTAIMFDKVTATLNGFNIVTAIIFVTLHRLDKEIETSNMFAKKTPIWYMLAKKTPILNILDKMTAALKTVIDRLSSKNTNGGKPREHILTLRFSRLYGNEDATNIKEEDYQTVDVEDFTESEVPTKFIWMTVVEEYTALIRQSTAQVGGQQYVCIRQRRNTAYVLVHDSKPLDSFVS